MNNQFRQLKSALAAAGYSLTKPRKAVFAALQVNEPLTLKQLIAACPSVDRASVYRTIALFEKLAIAHRLQIGWKYKFELSDSFQHHHHHLTCLECGKIIPLQEDQTLELRLERLAQAYWFNMVGHQLEIHGTCQECQPQTAPITEITPIA